MVNLVNWIEQDSAGSPQHLGKSLPNKLTMTEYALCAYLVSRNLPLKLNISVGTLAELATNHPTPLEWPNNKPINATSQKS